MTVRASQAVADGAPGDPDAALEAIIRGDPLRWRLLGFVRSLELPDCWIGAGFARNAVWDYLHRRPLATPTGDVDVLWFDPERTDRSDDAELEATLRILDPSVQWSVKNQARMHARNGDAPYASATDAMRFWPETATAVAVRRTRDDRCELAAPFGLDDLFGLVLRPTLAFSHAKRDIYEERVRGKGWMATWPLLRPAEPDVAAP